MTFRWWGHRKLDDFAEAIRPELRAMPVPPPSADLLARILIAREAGARTILPMEAGPHRRLSARHVVIPVLVAAVLLVVVFPIRDEKLDVGSLPGSSTSWFSGVAFAQTEPVSLPRLAPVRVTEPGGLHPLDVEYARAVRDSSGRMVTETREHLSLVPDSVEGIPAWRFTHATRHERRPTQVDVDTVLVARSDLRMLTHVAVEAPYSRFARIQVTQRMFGDSITGVMTALATNGPNPRRTFARRLDPRYGPYIPDAMTLLFLMAVSVDRSWSGGLSVLGWAVRDNDVFVPIELRVEGEERVQVPAGRFDCWRLSIRFRGREIQYWVRKSDGIGVRIRDDNVSASRGTRETVLVRG